MDRSVKGDISLEYVQQTEVFDRNVKGYTALFQAVVDRKPVKYLQKLIDEGADESVCCGWEMMTPLLRSMCDNYPVQDTILFLIQTRNAPVNVGDKFGDTPLSSLISVDYEMVYLEQLLQNGANPFIIKKYGTTARIELEQKPEWCKSPKIHAIINRLKMVEDCLIEDINHTIVVDDSMAVMMGVHKRLGAESSLSELDPDVLRMVIKHYMEKRIPTTPDDVAQMENGKVSGYVKSIMAKLDETP